MNKETIYTVLLSKEFPFDGRNYPLYGFSYRLEKKYDGSVVMQEQGHPTRIILWDKDGPELADLTEQMVKERVEEILS